MRDPESRVAASGLKRTFNLTFVNDWAWSIAARPIETSGEAGAANIVAVRSKSLLRSRMTDFRAVPSSALAAAVSGEAGTSAIERILSYPAVAKLRSACGGR